MYLRTTASVLVVLFVLLAAAGTAESQFPEKLTQNPCVSKTTCHDCIQTKSCAWCMQPDFGDKPRCFQPSLTAFTGGCPEEYTWNPDYEFSMYEHEQLTIARGAAVTGGGSAVSGVSISESSSSGSSYREHIEQSAGGSSHYSGSGASFGSSSASGKIVQMYPQRVGLKLRISKWFEGQALLEEIDSIHFILFFWSDEPYNLKVNYAQAEDYPVDLYYLMDLSKSMEDDKDKLSKLGDTLSDTMRNITSNFKLGFGSFVDKVLMPYVSTVPKK